MSAASGGSKASPHGSALPLELLLDGAKTSHDGDYSVLYERYHERHLNHPDGGQRPIYSLP